AAIVLSLPTVTLFNNSGVDLEIVRGDRVVAMVLPGQSREFTPEPEEWIHSGMIAHRYDFATIDWTTLSTSRTGLTIRLQAERDGGIYFASKQFSMPPDPQQPAGFPLRPVQVVDLTNTPHANQPMHLTAASGRR